MKLRHVTLQNGLAILLVEDDEGNVLWQRMLAEPLDDKAVEVIRELVEDLFDDCVSGGD
jgi:hypothetical protein